MALELAIAFLGLTAVGLNLLLLEREKQRSAELQRICTAQMRLLVEAKDVTSLLQAVIEDQKLTMDACKRELYRSAQDQAKLVIDLEAMRVALNGPERSVWCRPKP